MDNFSIPSNIIFGENSITELKGLLEQFKVKNILIVCDGGVRKVGIVDKVFDEIKGLDYKISIFDKVMPNPTDILISECVKEYRDKNIECIIAVGGGSAIDSAKAINVVLSNGGEIMDYEVPNSVKNRTFPLIAIPTTSGTASEVTGFTIITDTTRKKKVVIGGKNISADLAILDYSLTYELPASITASTGMDALTHAIEAYVSTLATPFTDVNALGAMVLILNNIEAAVKNGEDKEARKEMMIGSTMAGIAFNSAVLGLVHAIAHPLGAHFNIAHGIANAIMLPYVIEYNGDHCEEKIRNIGEILGLTREMSTPEKVSEKILEINNKIEIPRLSEIGIKKSDFDFIAEAVLQEPSLAMNPKAVIHQAVVGLLDKAY
ncbi:iron-containing alcohol dehydrogenase [Wukongibacter baidiensis]|uniref:iron-containing alcohol dehydrogenase family protein n=1 Tax=Wukongibacter baidiensis TaxID=1723361 RepID=UPI003D7F83DD